MRREDGDESECRQDAESDDSPADSKDDGACKESAVDLVLVFLSSSGDCLVEAALKRGLFLDVDDEVVREEVDDDARHDGDEDAGVPLVVECEQIDEFGASHHPCKDESCSKDNAYEEADDPVSTLFLLLLLLDLCLDVHELPEEGKTRKYEEHHGRDELDARKVLEEVRALCEEKEPLPLEAQGGNDHGYRRDHGNCTPAALAETRNASDPVPHGTAAREARAEAHEEAGQEEAEEPDVLHHFQGLFEELHFHEARHLVVLERQEQHRRRQHQPRQERQLPLTRPLVHGYQPVEDARPAAPAPLQQQVHRRRDAQQHPADYRERYVARVRVEYEDHSFYLSIVL